MAMQLSTTALFPGHTDRIRGGAVSANGGFLEINKTTLSGNSASYGGGLFLSAVTVTISDSTISGNTALAGGGLLQYSGDLYISGSTLSGNTAVSNHGGGAYFGRITTVNPAQAVIRHSTITGNTANNDGGGVIIATALATLTLSHTIIAGNTAGGTSNEVFGQPALNDYNFFGHSGLTNAEAFSGFIPGGLDITATSDGTDPTPLADILDTTLADNGGPTLTHALVTGSPAIDAGNVAASPGVGDVPLFDQRG